MTGLLLSITAPMFAQQLITGDPPEAVLTVAQAWGDAHLETDNQGDPMLVGTIEGIRYVGFFYGCGKGGTGCRSLELRASWTVDYVSLEHINEWNSTTRFGKAYIASDGDVVLEMEVNLDYGVTRDNLDDTFDWWRIGMTEYVEHLRNR